MTKESVVTEPVPVPHVVDKKLRVPVPDSNRIPVGLEIVRLVKSMRF